MKAGKSQNELAMVLGTPYNQQMISEVERGQGNLPLDRAALAVQEIGVSLDYLAGLTDDPTPYAGAKSMTISPNIQNIRGRIAQIGIIQADLAATWGSTSRCSTHTFEDAAP